MLHFDVTEDECAVRRLFCAGAFAAAIAIAACSSEQLPSAPTDMK